MSGLNSWPYPIGKGLHVFFWGSLIHTHIYIYIYIYGCRSTTLQQHLLDERCSLKCSFQDSKSKHKNNPTLETLHTEWNEYNQPHWLKKVMIVKWHARSFTLKLLAITYFNFERHFAAMPVAEAALFTGFAHSLWSYNRENWQWDWQVQQACEFQRQNMAVSRYSLFREDIRDLAALTVNKMDSYLIVNTLKLGFIVTIFLNYDRTDGPQHPGYMERQVTLLFSVCFLTAFLFLLISIWLSMHASIVAQSFTTKMLLQAARIPVATDQQISSAVPAAKAYETNLDDAFRLPLQGTMGTSAWTGKRPGPLGPQAGPQGPAPGPRVSPVPWAPPSPPSEGRDPPSFPNIRLPEQSAQGATSEELDANPHLKFYSFLMRNWQTFDLYSKVCMSIGTSTLLSGIAYYATFFSRSSSEELDPFASGWFCFGFHVCTGMVVCDHWCRTPAGRACRLGHCIIIWSHHCRSWNHPEPAEPHDLGLVSARLLGLVSLWLRLGLAQRIAATLAGLVVHRHFEPLRLQQLCSWELGSIQKLIQGTSACSCSCCQSTATMPRGTAERTCGKPIGRRSVGTGPREQKSLARSLGTGWMDWCV